MFKTSTGAPCEPVDHLKPDSCWAIRATAFLYSPDLFGLEEGVPVHLFKTGAY
jgi:hypothetical protein